ncbi:MAG: hypothetical protein OIF48_10720 [Silicimonas sp.]|nr:hypothetical protein [Silicimonas sp.]
MIRLWDGLLSGLCAVITLVVIGVPLWGAIAALRAGLVPGWVWAPVAGLGLAGLVLTLAFGRKAARGVHPLRERRR